MFLGRNNAHRKNRLQLIHEADAASWLILNKEGVPWSKFQQVVPYFCSVLVAEFDGAMNMWPKSSGTSCCDWEDCTFQSYASILYQQPDMLPPGCLRLGC